MTDNLNTIESRQRIGRVLTAAGVSDVRVGKVTGLSGGSVGQAIRVQIRDSDGGHRWLFVKRQAASFAGHFRCELDGLNQLRRAGGIGVATPVGLVVDSESAWLVTQWEQTETAGAEFPVRFGRELAAFHRGTRGDRIGLDADNFLGAANQPNSPLEHWTEFFAVRRLQHQIRWAVDQQRATTRLRGSVERLIARLSDVLEGRTDETCLLHGDLWSGNYLSTAGGRPVLIDPAIYYGCREAEFGMLTLFGGCSAEFYRAYEAEWPLAAGWQRRVKVYVLYHLLNHLNLFGGGYLADCESVADETLQV